MKLKDEKAEKQYRKHSIGNSWANSCKLDICAFIGYLFKSWIDRFSNAQPWPIREPLASISKPQTTMIGLIIFLIVVFLIAYFLSKHKDGDESTAVTAEDEMTTGERGAKYELKRTNFQQNTIKCFNFLVGEFGRNPAEDQFD